MNEMQKGCVIFILHISDIKLIKTKTIFSVRCAILDSLQSQPKSVLDNYDMSVYKEETTD